MPGCGGHVDAVACAVEHLADEPHHVVVLGAVLRGRPSAQRPDARALPRWAPAGHVPARHMLSNSCAALAHQQLGRAAAEEHVGVAVQQHGAARRAVDKVHQQVLRRERLRPRSALPRRDSTTLSTRPALDGVKPASTARATPRASRAPAVYGDAAAVAGGAASAWRDEACDAARVYRAKRVHLQKRAALVLDEHHFGQHELQAGETPRTARRQAPGSRASKRLNEKNTGGCPPAGLRSSHSAPSSVGSAMQRPRPMKRTGRSLR